MPSTSPSPAGAEIQPAAQPPQPLPTSSPLREEHTARHLPPHPLRSPPGGAAGGHSRPYWMEQGFEEGGLEEEGHLEGSLSPPQLQVRLLVP